MKIKFIAILLLTGLLFGSLSISNNVHASEQIGKIIPSDTKFPPTYPPGLEKEGMTRAISTVTSEKDISDIKQKGCTVIHRLNTATSFFCPTPIMDSLENVRPVKVYQTHDLWQSQQIRADDVWDSLGYDGTGVTVAVLDTGVQADHAELTGSIYNTADFTNQGGDYLDTNGHGTHVSGIISGDGVYSLQSTSNKATGAAPGSTLIVGKVCGNFGCPEDAILAGITWAQNQGADIINMSLGGGLSTASDCDASNDNIVNSVNNAVSNGVVVVISSGNDGNKNAVSYPGCASGAIAVGAVDINDKDASFSNAGPAMDVVAPGVSTLSSYSCNVSPQYSCSSTWYASLSGTSMSSPHVAGVVALMLDKNPTLTVSQVKEALYSTAIPVGPNDGHGRVDAYAAVSYFSSVTDTIPPVITLDGANPQIIELGDGYTELGATTDDGSPVTIDTSAFVDAVGSYTIYYDSTDSAGNNANQVTRTVNVVDTTAPVITLDGANPQIIELGDGYTELGATTDDDSPVTIDTSAFVDAVGSYTIYYDSTDSAGNDANQVTRTVNVVDNTITDSTAFVNELNGNVSGKKNKTYQVTITVNTIYENIRIEGTWSDVSDNIISSSYCDVSNSNQCTTGLTTKADTMTFTVTNISGQNITYDPTQDSRSEITLSADGGSGGGDSGGGGSGGEWDCVNKYNPKKCTN